MVSTILRKRGSSMAEQSRRKRQRIKCDRFGLHIEAHERLPANFNVPTKKVFLVHG